MLDLHNLKHDSWIVDNCFFSTGFCVRIHQYSSGDSIFYRASQSTVGWRIQLSGSSKQDHTLCPSSIFPLHIFCLSITITKLRSSSQYEKVYTSVGQDIIYAVVYLGTIPHIFRFLRLLFLSWSLCGFTRSFSCIVCSVGFTHDIERIYILVVCIYSTRWRTSLINSFQVVFLFGCLLRSPSGSKQFPHRMRWTNCLQVHNLN